MRTSDQYPNRCGNCGDPITPDGALHVWSGRVGMPDHPYDHPAEKRPIELEPFDPATSCHRDPSIGGDPDGACSSIQPCELRCHIRWLDGQIQPNDSFVDTRPYELADDLPLRCPRCPGTVMVVSRLLDEHNRTVHGSADGR